MVHKAHPDKHPHPEKHEEAAAPAPAPAPAPVVKYERAPPAPGKVRVKMQKLTDEVNHGTTSYPVDSDGIVDLPPEAAAIVMKQGGAELLKPTDPPPVEGNIQIQHVGDPTTILAYGDQNYAPSGGIMTIPLAIWPEVEPHGFVAIEVPT